MGVVTAVKIKLGEIAAKDLSRKAEQGEFGQRVQRSWAWLRGKKTAIGFLLSIVTLAVSEFAPPWADSYVRYSGIAAGFMVAVGLLDKARRKEPIFEPWFLEALGAVSDALAGVSGFVMCLSTSGTLDLLFPGNPGLSDAVDLWSSAITSATAFLGRLARASAAQ